jgi:sugar lactone lactonase YvrE
VLRIVGIHVDATRGRVWFATWAPDSTHRSDSTETPSLTRLFLAELATGRMVRSWTVSGGRPDHLLNDLVVLGDGSLFLTDTEDGSIYRLRSPADSLELFVQPDAARFSTANGITSTPDGRTLYVGYLEGIARIDVASRSIELVPSPDSVSTAAVDGLYWYRGGLVAIQHIPTLERVVQYSLSPDGRRIVAGAVRERGLPVVHEPTTGTIVGSRFFYIANSQFGRLDDHNVLAPQSGSPKRTVIRVVDLPR